MNKIAIILSHCNTEEKKTVLKNLIEKLKGFDNLDILITSHIPLEYDIIDMVDYFVYDKSNPIISWPLRAFEHFKTFDHKGVLYLLSYYLDDYGYTPMNQIQIGYSTIRNKNYDQIFFMNYDTRIGEEETREINSDEIETKIFKVRDTYGEVSDYSLIFSKFNNSDISKLVDLIDVKSYLNFSHAEKYFEHLVRNFNIVRSDHETTDIIDFSDGTNGTLFNHSTDDRYKIFYSNFHQRTYEKDSQYFIYDVEQDIRVKINDEIYKIKKGETEIFETENVVYIEKNDSFEEVELNIKSKMQSIVEYEKRRTNSW